MDENFEYGSHSYTSAMFIGVVLLALVFIWPSSSNAQASPWHHFMSNQVRLISAVAGVGEKLNIPLGLQILLSNGWKTYWRSPGDAGIPVTIEWIGSHNVHTADIAWPAPQRFTEYGIDTIGYDEEVVIPIMVIPERPGEAIKIRAEVHYATCSDVCVYHEVELALDIPSAVARHTEYKALIDYYLRRVPRISGGPFTVSGIRTTWIKKSRRLEITAIANPSYRFQNPDLFIEGTSGIAFLAPTVRIQDNGTRAIFLLEPIVQALESNILKRQYRATLVDGNLSIETSLNPHAPE